LGGGAILAGALLDKPVDRFMKQHQGSGALRTWANVGKDLPLALAGASGAAVLFGDARMENMGWISLQAIAGAGALSVATKHLAGRARPGENLGQWSKTSNSADASFPSNHATVAFAAVTPFAQEYDAPWLYGLAAASSLGRTANRQHWVSDVVAGGVLGYAVGSWLWQSQRNDTRSSFALSPGVKSISLAWRGSY
jgi:membrane-associated phospholipid phosphatase